MKVQPCSAKTGDGIWEGINFIGDIFDQQRNDLGSVPKIKKSIIKNKEESKETAD